jgi:hypothetical protein
MFPVVNAWLIWMACRPTKLSGFVILYLEKFPAALRKRLIQLQWVDERNAQIGHGNPYNFTFGYGEKRTILTSPWIDDICPKDIMPNAYNKSKRKHCTAWKALVNIF